MPAIERGLDRLSFLPDSLREALRRRLRELGGVALIVLAILLALALASWSVSDPSLSHATNAPVRNLLGVPGAIIADLLTQILGIASIALVLPVAVWGWRLASHRPLNRERVRLGVWLVGMLLAAAFASCLPRSGAWPLPAGLGGVIGDAMLRVPLFFSNGFNVLTRIGIAAVSGIGMVLAFAVASGCLWQGDQDEDEEDDAPPKRGRNDKEPRSFVSLGLIVHAFLSTKARLLRLLERRPPARVAIRREPPAHGRPEPRFEA